MAVASPNPVDVEVYSGSQPSDDKREVASNSAPVCACAEWRSRDSAPVRDHPFILAATMPMLDVTHYPALVFLLSVTGLWASARIGASFHKWRFSVDDKDARSDYDVILGATLTLLGLIIGFSFSMAINRYDLRKNLEEAEANAIGTEFVRIDMLSRDDAAKVRLQLRRYLDERIRFYRAHEEDELRKVHDITMHLQGELWSAVKAPAIEQPTPIAALVVQGMNDVINAQGYAQAAWWNRIPIAAWSLMLAIAVCSSLLVGYGSRSARAGTKLLLILPFVISIAFMLIADIDAPRHGLIEVQPQNLTGLGESLRER